MSGAYKVRREDHRLVTGQGRYTADWNLPGQAHGSFLRSDRPHAEIVTLELAEALRSPGVLGVFCGEDLAKAGFKSPRPIAHFKGKDGSVLKNPHRSALARERVRFVGEPVALVVAESEWAAQDAAERIAVDYRDLAALIEPEDALARSAPILHPDVPRNVAVDYEYGNRAATEAAFAQAAHVARVDLHAQRIAGNPMEPKACVVAYDGGTGSYDVYIPTQGCRTSKPSLPTSPAMRARNFGFMRTTLAARSGCATRSIRNSRRSCSPPGRSDARSNGSGRVPKRS